MAKKLGTIKSISGSAEVIAVDKSGNQRVLKVGDSLYEGETVKTTSADSKVVIATNNGKELSMIGEDTLSLDPRATTGDSQVAALQKALLNGANLENLEETAAGGTSGGRAGDGVSLGETRFEHGGHYSNVSTSTSAINPLGAFGFASPETGVRGGLDNGGTGGGTDFYIDTTAPVVTINSINPVDTNNPADGNPDKGIVKGHSDEPNAPVVVKDKDGKIIGSGTTDDKGNFEVTTDPIKPGDKVTVEVTDKAGNTGKGDGTAGNTVYTDTTPPTVEDVKVTPVDTNNPADGNPDKGIVKGHSDEPNAPVVVKDKDGKIIGSGTTDDKGNFEVTTDPIKPGDKVTVEVTDKAGNTGKGDGTAGNTVYTDTTPPTVEDVKVTPVDENNPADGNPDKGIVKGHSDEPNAPVVVKDKDGKIIGSGTTDDKGNFEVTTDPIKPGDKVTVEVTDKAGNTGKGDGTAGNTVYTDTTPPTVEDVKVTPVDENNPADGNPDKGIVKGHSDEPNAPVVVKDKDGKIIGSGTTDDKGNFEVTTDPIKPGDKVTVEVTDKAGNTGKGDGTAGNIEHPNDHTAPTEPTITFVEDTNPKDGKLNKAENGSDSDNANTTAKISIPADAVVNDVIKYTVNGEKKSHPITEADKAKGHIEVKVPVVDGQTSTITAKIVDQAGNASKEVSGSVDVDLTIGNPKVRFLEDTDNNGVLSVAEVAAIKDGKAHWVIDIPTDGSVKAGDVIQSIDSKGNWVKFVTITDEMIKDGRFEATFNVDIEKLRNGKYETPEYRFADEAGNVSESSKATLTLDSELTRQPSNPSIKFPEDTNEDGKISDKENKAGDKDAGKTTAEVVIPQDGSVKPGDKLVVTDENGKQTEKTIGQGDIDKGSIDVPVDLNPGKDNTIIAEIVNPNNPDNPGKGKGVIGENSEATKAPEAPVITDVIDDVEGGQFNQSVKGGLTNDSTPTIKGTVKAGSTVIIYDNGVEIGRIENANANWEFTTPVLTKQGEHKFTAIAKNEFGESGSSNEATIELDTIAPVIKEVTITPIDTAAKADDTAEATLIVGVTDTPHATVIAKDKDGNFLGRADANDKGGFVIDAKPVNPGDKVVFEVTDKAGNTSESEFKAGDLAHPNDHTAPKVDIETVTPVDETKPSDGTPDKGIVKGKSDEPNAPVVVTDENGKTIGTGTTDDKGNFEVTTDPIKPGDKVTVEVTDKAGNKGKDTETAGDTDIIHKDLPEVPVINEVIDNVKGYGEDTKVGNILDVEGHLTNDKTPTIKGTAKAGSTVVIYDNGVEIGKIENADANWEFTTSELTKQGEHKFTAIAVNKFGKSAPSNEATIDLDSIAPKLDNVKITPIDTNSRADDTAEITMGTGHTDTPNAEILFRDGDNNIIGKGHANNSGDFAIQLDKAVQPGTPVFVQAIDKAGNAGTDMAVAGNIEHPNDHTAPTEPTITFVEDTNPKDGKLNKAENGSDSDNANTTAKISIPADAVVNDVIKYTVNGEKKSHPITEADKAKGHIEVKVPVVDGQTSTITAKIVDQAGNASKEVSGSVDVDLTIGNPKVRFLEDTDNNGVLSVAEVAAIKDGKAHWVIDIPTDGSVKAGDVIQSIDSKGNWVKFVTITDEMIKDGRFEATFNVDIEKLRNGKYETPEYRFADEAGNVSESSKATLTLDGEFSRTPGSPLDINFKEDTNKDGKISNKENQDGDKEVGKTTAEISIPKDGSVKPGDKLIVKDNSDTPKEHVITDKDIENGKVEVTVDIKTGDKTTITAEIVNPNNPSKPSEEISKDITEASSTVQVTIDEIYDDVAGGVVNGDVKNGLTNDNLPTFKGSAAPGATVEIYESFLTTTEKTLVGKTVADANGKWSFTPTEAMGDGLHYFEAHATDSAGNKSITPKVELDVDATAPSVENLKVSPLDISNPADNTPEKGRVEGSSDTQDAKVIVKDEAGNVIGEGKVGGDGKFVIDTTKALNPGDKVKVEITDEAGNTGKGSAVTGNDIIHTHATTQVTIDEIYDDVAGGVVNGDVKNGLTNDNLPTFKGSAAPGATVEIYESFLTTTEKTLVGKTVADANGKWSFTPTEAMGDGLHYFEAHATDSAGNKSITPKVELDVDATANAPVINAVNDDVDSHTGNVLDVKTKVALTNDSTPTLEGYAEPNSVVTIYEISELSGDKRAIGTTTADKHGGWKFELPQLEDGEYQYTTRIQDKAGNISDFSETVVVNVDLVAPTEPTITFVEDINKKDGKLNKAENGKDGDNASTTAQISVPGDAEENDVIHYTVNGEEKTHTITYNDRVAGYIEVKVPVIDGQASTVTAKIVDQAGNASEMVKESISSDFTAPNVQITGIIDNVPGGTYKDNVAGTSTNDNKPTIKGTADANQEVVIYDTDKEIGRTTADKDGKWEFKPIDYKEPLADLVGRVHIIKAVVTDAAGNSSEATSALEVDTTVGTPKVKFKEDLNSNEVLSVEEAKALTDGKLHWIVDIPTDGISVKAGDILQVYGQDGKWKNATFITKEDIAKGSVERDGFVMDLPKGNGAQSPAYRIVDIVGNESEGNFANLVYDKELTRQPSNPSIKFPEDTNEDGKISDKENKAGDKDAGKTTAEVVIPQDGSVKPGDKLVVTDENGKQTEKTIGQGDIDKGSIDVPVDLNPGKDNTIIAEIVNPNNPDNPGKGKGVIGENSEATKAPEAPVITDVIDDVEGGQFNQSVKGGLTNDSTPTIKGTVKAGSTVIIYDNGVEIGRIENANANWEFTTPVLTKQGEHKFTAIAKNEFGESGSSNEATIELDTIAPSVENVKVTPIDMSDPADSTSEKGRVEGRSDTPGAIVVIKDQAGNEIGRDNVKADKSFTIETTKPINKGDKVTVEITDEAGNTGKGEAEAGNVKHEGDNAAPCDPTITFVEDTAPKDGKLNKAENSSDSDNASTKAHISFFPDVVKGDVIKYTINNGKEQNHTVTADDVKAGYIEVKVPVVDGKTSSVTAKIVDQAGNASEAVTSSIDVDLTSMTPTIDQVTDNQYGGIQDGNNVLGIDDGLTNDSTPTFKGTAEPGATIVLKNGNDIISKDIIIKADANGNWEFTPKTALADGEYNVTAIATDKAGNVSDPSNVATINIDTNCPKPVITEIVDNTAGGVVNGDVKNGLTNDNTPTLKGTAEPGSTVKVWIDGLTKASLVNGEVIYDWTTTTKGDGTWEFVLPKLEDGRHLFVVKATDKAGTNSPDSDTVGVTVDTTAGAPKVMITADADDNNILTATEASALTDGKLKWVIKLPEDAKVGDRIEVSNSHREWVTILTLSAADIAKGEVARDDFSADFVKGKTGFETPSYRIVDQAGNVSTEHWDTVKFDKSAPTSPVIKEVIDDVKGYEKDTKVGNVLDVKGGLTNDNMPTIKGTAEAGIKVNIYDNGKWIGDAKANANGNWEFTPEISAALPDGKHSITAVAENALGVNSEPSNAANIDVDTVTPKPTIEKVTDNVEGGVYHGDVKGGLTNDNRPVFEGKAEKGAFVELIDNGKVIGTTEAGEDGKWTIQPKEPMADGKHNMVVQATDLAGNRSRSDQSSSDVETNAGVVKITAVCDDVAGYNGKVGNILGVNNGLTNDSTPTIKGAAKPGTTITIKDGNSVIDGVIKYNGDGSWEFTPKTPFADGEHKLTAIATSRTSGAQSVSNVATIDVDTTIRIELTEVTPIAEGGTPGAHISKPTIIMNTISRGNHIPTTTGDDYVKVKGSVNNRANINLCDGNDTLAIGGVVTDGVVINAGRGNDKIVIGDYLGGLSSRGTKIDLGEGGANIVKTHLVGESDERNAKFIIKDKNNIQIGEGKTDADGKFDMFIDKAIKPGEKLSVEIVDAAGNKASDSKAASHIEVSGVRYYDNELDVGTNIHAATVVAGNGNDLVVVGEKGKPDGYITANSKIDLGEGDNEIRVRTNIDHSEIKTGSGDDIVTTGLKGNGFGYITNESKIDLGDGNNKLNVGANIDGSTIELGKGDDTAVVKGWINDNAVVNLGDGNNTLTVGTNIDKATVLAGSGNDEVVVGKWQHAGDSWITNYSTIKLGDGDNKLTVGTNIDSSSIETGKGNDVIKVGGYIHSSKVDLGAGDDTLSIGKVDLDNSKVDGGAGYDKLVLENPDKSVNLSDISKFASNFEELDISGAKNTTLKVSIKDVLDMTDDKNTLKITGDKGDIVDLKENIGAGGWSKGASEDGYTTYTNNTVTIQIKDEIHVI